PATIVPSADDTFVWLFPSQPMPGASLITLTIDGGSNASPGIRTASGQLLDADGDGTPGGRTTITFTTVGNAAVPNTTLTGIIADPGPDLQPGSFDDERAGPDGVLMTRDDLYLNRLVGATVYILGRESEAVVTGADGSFTLTHVPTGSVKLVVNGRTATAIEGDPTLPPNHRTLPTGV